MTTDIFLTRKEAADYLVQKFGRPASVTEKTLAKMACTGGGPTFHLFGRKPGYKSADLDAWMQARMSGPKTSTSDLRQPA